MNWKQEATTAFTHSKGVESGSLTQPLPNLTTPVQRIVQPNRQIESKLPKEANCEVRDRRSELIFQQRRLLNIRSKPREREPRSKVHFQATQPLAQKFKENQTNPQTPTIPRPTSWAVSETPPKINQKKSTNFAVKRNVMHWETSSTKDVLHWMMQDINPTQLPHPTKKNKRFWKRPNPHHHPSKAKFPEPPASCHNTESLGEWQTSQTSSTSGPLLQATLAKSWNWSSEAPPNGDVRKYMM